MEISTVSIVTDKNTLTSRSRDNCFQIVNDITIVENIVRVDQDQETYIIFRKFTKKESYGQYPLPSANIGVYTVWGLPFPSFIQIKMSTSVHIISSCSKFICSSVYQFISS